VAFLRAERVMLKPGFDKDMTLLAYFKKSNSSKTLLPSPTGPLSLRMPSFCIELTRRPTNGQKSWREQATQRPSWPQNQPNEERMKSTHPRKRQRPVVIHGTTATIRPRHTSRNFAITKFLTRN